MYGLVLMTALAAGAETPSSDAGMILGGSCNGVVMSSGCYGSSSCYGSGCVGSSCYGSSCYGSSCYGSSCYGNSCQGSSCHGNSCNGGGGLFSRLRARLAARRSSNSCHGSSSCYGSSCYGSSCYGSSCYGSSCYGSSCYGSSCYGSSCYGSGCYGSSCYGTSTPTYFGTDFQMGGGCAGVIIGANSTVPNVSIPATDEVLMAQAKPNAAPAQLVIELPAEAKLYVDGSLTKGEGSSRKFHTPDLPKAETFYYTLKAEVMVAGKPVVETKKVLVRAGEVANETFTVLISAVKSEQENLRLATK